MLNVIIKQIKLSDIIMAEVYKAPRINFNPTYMKPVPADSKKVIGKTGRVSGEIKTKVGSFFESLFHGSKNNSEISRYDRTKTNILELYRRYKNLSPYKKAYRDLTGYEVSSKTDISRVHELKKDNKVFELFKAAKEKNIQKITSLLSEIESNNNENYPAVLVSLKNFAKKEKLSKEITELLDKKIDTLRFNDVNLKNLKYIPESPEFSTYKTWQKVAIGTLIAATMAFIGYGLYSYVGTKPLPDLNETNSGTDLSVGQPSLPSEISKPPSQGLIGENQTPKIVEDKKILFEKLESSGTPSPKSNIALEQCPAVDNTTIISSASEGKGSSETTDKPRDVLRGSNDLTNPKTSLWGALVNTIYTRVDGALDHAKEIQKNAAEYFKDPKSFFKNTKVEPPRNNDMCPAFHNTTIITPTSKGSLEATKDNALAKIYKPRVFTPSPKPQQAKIILEKKPTFLAVNNTAQCVAKFFTTPKSFFKNTKVEPSQKNDTCPAFHNTTIITPTNKGSLEATNGNALAKIYKPRVFTPSPKPQQVEIMPARPIKQIITAVNNTAQCVADFFNASKRFFFNNSKVELPNEQCPAFHNTTQITPKPSSSSWVSDLVDATYRRVDAAIDDRNKIQKNAIDETKKEAGSLWSMFGELARKANERSDNHGKQAKDFVKDLN